MTNIIIKKTNNLTEQIKVLGHTGYDDYGKDIVCASISSIVITSINAMIRIDETSVSYKEESGRIELKIIKHNKVLDALIDNMIDLLTDLEHQYPKNIKINEEV